MEMARTPESIQPVHARRSAFARSTTLEVDTLGELLHRHQFRRTPSSFHRKVHKLKQNPIDDHAVLIVFGGQNREEDSVYVK